MPGDLVLLPDLVLPSDSDLDTLAWLVSPSGVRESFERRGLVLGGSGALDIDHHRLDTLLLPPNIPATRLRKAG